MCYLVAGGPSRCPTSTKRICCAVTCNSQDHFKPMSSKKVKSKPVPPSSTTSARRQQSSAGQGSSRQKTVRYFTTFTNTIADVLASRGWKEVGEHEDWDFVWADREWTYAAFDKLHLENNHKLNHFRNGRELCRKDLMAKNLKKKRRTLEKEGKVDEAQAYDFIPTTFVLPREYSLFVEVKKLLSNTTFSDLFLTKHRSLRK